MITDSCVLTLKLVYLLFDPFLFVVRSASDLSQYCWIVRWGSFFSLTRFPWWLTTLPWVLKFINSGNILFFCSIFVFWSFTYWRWFALLVWSICIWLCRSISEMVWPLRVTFSYWFRSSWPAVTTLSLELLLFLPAISDLLNLLLVWAEFTTRSNEVVSSPSIMLLKKFLELPDYLILCLGTPVFYL